MTYQQTIDYLYAHLPMFSRVGAVAYKEDLHNTIALCNAIGNPHAKFNTIHIAGTNGKGSTSHMLAAILQQSGYKTGLYTSPHLKDFRERIRINGRMVSEDFVIEFTERIKTLSEQIEPSFFEVTVAMAFDYFAKEQVDIAVIETGLGGRLDSTNIITPLLSIITNIGYDHMNLLGDTLEKIAMEKAGIIKPGIPVVIGEWLPETKPIFQQKAMDLHAPVSFASDEYEVSNLLSNSRQLTCSLRNVNTGHTQQYALDLNGLYQTNNLRTVICALNLLVEQGFNLPPAAVKEALASVKKLTGLQGRWDIIAENPTVVLDVAHNEDGMLQVLKQVAAFYAAPGNDTTKKQVHFVIGMVKDKEVAKVLSLLPATAQYYFTHAHIPRAMNAEALRIAAAGYGLPGKAFEDVNKALAAARLTAGANDLVIVCGSVFLVGELNTAT